MNLTFERQQNGTADKVPVYLYASDGTPVSGVTPTITLDKTQSGTYGAVSGSVGSSDANGVAWWTGHATDRNTLGVNSVKVTGAGAVSYTFTLRIVAYDPASVFDGGNRVDVGKFGGSAGTFSGGKPAVTVDFGDTAGIDAGVWNYGDRILTGGVTVNGYATGQSPADLVDLSGIPANVWSYSGSDGRLVGGIDPAVQGAGFADPKYLPASADALASVPAAVRDVDNTAPAADSLGEAVNAAGGSAGSLAGPGADQVTLRFYSDPPANSTPIADADVWVTTDSAGNNVVAGTLRTNSSGEVMFLLDAGEPYYVWLQKDGVNPIRGEAFTAAAD